MLWAVCREQPKERGTQLRTSGREPYHERAPGIDLHQSSRLKNSGDPPGRTASDVQLEILIQGLRLAFHVVGSAHLRPVAAGQISGRTFKTFPRESRPVFPCTEQQNQAASVDV